MATFYYGLVLFVLLCIYAICKVKQPTETDYIQCVEAGSIQEADAELLERKSYKTAHKTLYAPDGTALGSEYFRIVINGNCMKPRKICHNDEIIVRKYYPNIELRQGDIIMLYIEDKQMYKLREIKNIEGNVLHTVRYDSDGREIISSKPHNINQVKGVVKYRI